MVGGLLVKQRNISGMYAYLDRLWERLAREGAADVSLLHSTRKRLLTFTAALTILIATIWVSLTAGSVIEGRPLVAVLCGLTPFLFLPYPYLALRSNVSLDLLSHLYLATLYVTVTLTATALGGMVSTTSFFLILLPLLGTLLFGIRVGLIWAAIITLTYTGLHIARPVLPPSTYAALSTAPNDWLRMQDVSFWNAAMMPLLALAAALSVANFRAIVGKSSALLDEAAHRTKDARDAQMAAEELARSKSEFMANVSHELRTPLNAIIGYTELMIESAEDRGAAEDAQDSRKVLEGALKLQGMINDVLKLAAIDAGKFSLDTEDCRPAELAAEALESVQPLLQSKGNVVRIADATRPGQWHGDGDKVGACMRNLLTNAAHCAAHGEIELRLSQSQTEDGWRLIVEVKDDGPSIDPDRVELLFEPFAQPEIGGTRHYEGMALNLALTRRLARLLGGDLSICTKAAGPRGACFRLDLPVRFLPDATDQSHAA